MSGPTYQSSVSPTTRSRQSGRSRGLREATDDLSRRGHRFTCRERMGAGSLSPSADQTARSSMPSNAEDHRPIRTTDASNRIRSNQLWLRVGSTNCSDRGHQGAHRVARPRNPPSRSGLRPVDQREHGTTAAPSLTWRLPASATAECSDYGVHRAHGCLSPVILDAAISRTRWSCSPLPNASACPLRRAPQSS